MHDIIKNLSMALMNFTNKNIPIIILAGGKGERFVTKENFPKQLAKVSDHPTIVEIIYNILKMVLITLYYH